MGEAGIEFARRAVGSACQLLYEGFHAADSLKINLKNDQSPVTSLDNQLNDHIAQLCRNNGFLLLSEEEGSTAQHGDNSMYVLDPIDGTGNLVEAWQQKQSVSIGGVSLGFWRQHSVFGVVGFPLLGSPTVVYSAGEGEGAWREINGKRDRLQVDTKPTRGVVLITAKENAQADYLAKRLTELGFVPMKIDGAVFKACAVADPGLLKMYKLDGLVIPEGVVVGFASYGVYLHDVAATSRIVQEAGGVATAPQNSAEKQSFVAANNAEVHKTLSELLEEKI